MKETKGRVRKMKGKIRDNQQRKLKKLVNSLKKTIFPENWKLN